MIRRWRMCPATCRERKPAGSKAGWASPRTPAGSRLPAGRWGRSRIPPDLPKREVIGFAQASMFFKSFQIHRSIDTEKNVLIYTVISTKLINGSPFNSISVVPVNVP